MKPLLSLLACLSLLLLAPLSGRGANLKEKEKNTHEPAAPHGSIRPKGKPNATQRAALAKIDFLAALNAAIAAVPGTVVYGELEVEDGNLEYDFQIITPGKKVMDVAIDAGDGKVLSAEEGDNE
jgi:uncharacterized membrane protein YkoI